MKKLTSLAALVCVLFLASCGGEGEKVDKPYNAGINITPIPMEMTQSEGVFTLTKGTTIVTNSEESDKIASFFVAKLKNSTGYDLSLNISTSGKNYIRLEIVADVPVNDEGYLMEVTADGIDIKAKAAHGLFNAMQTVMQLLPAEIESPKVVNNIAWNIPAVKIKDEPRFSYRGLHLDVCRHFRDVDFIKKQLDVLALFKINKFHWHLTEDQGWRIEIKKYPKLTEAGATRKEGEGNTYGPYFYTQEQVKEVVAYAKERFIEVIPEIELPGHGVAALSAYPEFSCTGKDIDVRNYWGVAADVYCAGNDATFEFLENIIAEVIPLFESEYFHIGGDECPKSRWKECPKCQARIKELGIKAEPKHTAEEKLQSYFVQRIEKFLLKHNKKMIGWDEILEGGLAPSATVMSWRGEDGGIEAANAGHDVIMTPGGWLYLDHYQGESKLLPVTIGGLNTLAKTYSYDPIPKDIQDDKKHHILGAQGNCWAEYKYEDADHEHDVYPRIVALAEATWSPLSRKDYKDFERRLENIRVRLDMHDVSYYMPMPETKGAPSCDFMAFTDSVKLEFKSTEPVKMVYTTDGTEPTLTSIVYDSVKPLVFAENTILKIRSVLMSEKMGKTRTITLDKQTYRPSIEKAADAKSGLKAEYYKGNVLTVDALKGQAPIETEYVESPQKGKYRIGGYLEVYDDSFYSTILTGYINVPEDGIYYFSTDHEMWIGDDLFVSNAHEVGTARRFSRSDKSIALAKGYHPVKIIRLGATFGGWPTQWENIYVQIRKEGEEKFQFMDASYFK